MLNKRSVFIFLSLVMWQVLSSCTPPYTGHINTQYILHANINCSDFEQSKNFYQMLGFVPLMEIDVDVSDPNEAVGLNMPPYQLHAAPMGLRYGTSESYVIDLIKWIDPYDPSPPYALINHLGLSRLSLKTTNLDADIALLQAQGVVLYADPVTINRPVENSRLVVFTDPDGTLIELVEPGDAVIGTPNASGTYISGALQTSVNCSNYEQSKSFYEMIGFVTQAEVEEMGSPELATAVGLPSYHVRASTMALPRGHSLNLTKWEDPYDTSTPYGMLNHIGIPRFAIVTNNLDEDVSILRDQGVEFYADPIRPSGSFGIFRFACFEDPDGTVIELVQYF